MYELRDWWRGVPRFTRYWFAGTIVIPLLTRFGFLNVKSLLLDYQAIKSFQLWRVITCVLWDRTNWDWLINLYFLYTYSRRLEEGEFQERPSDYLFMLIFNWTCCVLAGLIVQQEALIDAMIMTVIYVWCQLNKDVAVTFFFGTRFRALYLPWVLTALRLVIAGKGFLEFIGILVGHLYFFLAFTYPQELGGPSLLTTPQFLKQWFPDKSNVRGFGSVPERAAPGAPPRRGFGHDWGRGQVLGGN